MIASAKEPDCDSRQWVFRLRPYTEASGIWAELRADDACSGLYQSDRWLRMLGRIFGIRLWMATVEDGFEVGAGCVLAQTKNPFSKRMSSLPFSDYCPPLGRNELAKSALLEDLPRRLSVPCEIRGVNGPDPWQTVICYQLWTIDLARPIAVIERAVNGGLRRKIRRAAEAGVEISCGSSLPYIQRYYALHAETRHRQGIPTQPFSLFTHLQETFSTDGSLQVWLASKGGIDVAGVVILRDGDQVYYKWGARRLSAPVGASHTLLWAVIREYTGKARLFDLGRADISNRGLAQFKKELGARPTDLPYSFFPKAPRHISAEALTGMRQTLSRVWSHLPGPVATGLGGFLYPYLG